MKNDYVEIKEILDVVTILEQEAYEASDGKTEYLNFEVITNGNCTLVNFIGINLWNSEDDDRGFDDKTNKYEPFEGYLRRRLNEELSILKLLNF